MTTKEKKLVDEDSTFERASTYSLIYAIIRQAAANNTEANTGEFPEVPTNDDIYNFLDLPKTTLVVRLAEAAEQLNIQIR